MNSSRLITWFLSITVFVLMPFFYSGQLQDVEQSPRFLALAIIVAISSVCNLIFGFKKGPQVKNDKLLMLFGIFFLLNVLAFSKSINFYDGLFDLLKLTLLFSLFLNLIVLFSIQKSNRDIVLKSVVISSLIFIGIAFIQLWPYIVSKLQDAKEFKINYSLASSLGNKNFFAETLLLMLPLSILSVFINQSFWRILSFLSAMLIIVFLILLQTLSTWLAGSVCILVFIVFLLKFKKRIFINPKWKKGITAGFVIFILILLAGGIAVYKIAGPGQIESRIITFKNQLHPEKANPDSLQQNSTAERMLLWKKSLQMVGDSPISGVGLSNWKIQFPAYGMGTASYMSSGGIRFVHPHNDYLYIASELGIVGLLVYLLMLAGLLIYIFKLSNSIQATKDLIFNLSMLLAVVAYMVISFFSMPYTRYYSEILFMVISALIISEYNYRPNGSSFIKFNLLRALFLISIVAASFSIYFGNIRLSSDFQLSSALTEERKNNIPSMQLHLDRINEKFFPVDFTATPIAWYKGFALFYKQDVKGAFIKFREAEKVNPNHLMVLNDLGSCYNLQGDPATAMDYYKRALKISPVFGDAIINLSIIYFNSNNTLLAYNTLISHRGKINARSVNVFATILSARALEITGKDQLPPEFVAKLKNQYTLMDLLIMINDHEGRLEDFL